MRGRKPGSVNSASKPYYVKEDGKWWYYRPSTGKRSAAEWRVCDGCKKRYLTRKRGSDRDQKYCSYACFGTHFSAYYNRENHPRWRGGRIVRGDGYIWVRHPTKDGYALEHRVVMAGLLERELLPTETVHHKNGDRADNRPDNLELRAGRHGRGATAPHCPTCTCLAH